MLQLNTVVTYLQFTEFLCFTTNMFSLSFTEDFCLKYKGTILFFTCKCYLKVEFDLVKFSDCIYKHLIQYFMFM